VGLKPETQKIYGKCQYLLLKEVEIPEKWHWAQGQFFVPCHTFRML